MEARCGYKSEGPAMTFNHRWADSNSNHGAQSKLLSNSSLYQAHDAPKKVFTEQSPPTLVYRSDYASLFK